jgi:hypothetical protein
VLQVTCRLTFIAVGVEFLALIIRLGKEIVGLAL